MKHKKRGSVTLYLMFCFLPIVAIFCVILWVRASSLYHLKAQRQLDRCVYWRLKDRCENLNELSALNSRLRSLIRVIVSLESAGKLASIVFPGLGGAVEVTASELRTVARALTAKQDWIMMQESIQSKMTMLCGFSQNSEVTFSRPENAQATFAGTPAPLSWVTGTGEIEVHSWNIGSLKKESYGYCKGSRDLDGEKYRVSFQHAPEVKLQSK